MASYVHVAEYKAPRGVAEEAAASRLGDVRAALPEALGIPAEDIIYKQRSRQRGSEQYQKQGSKGELLQVQEGRANCWSICAITSIPVYSWIIARCVYGSGARQRQGFSQPVLLYRHCQRARCARWREIYHQCRSIQYLPRLAA